MEELQRSRGTTGVLTHREVASCTGMTVPSCEEHRPHFGNKLAVLLDDCRLDMWLAWLDRRDSHISVYLHRMPALAAV